MWRKHQWPIKPSVTTSTTPTSGRHIHIRQYPSLPLQRRSGVHCGGVVCYCSCSLLVGHSDWERRLGRPSDACFTGCRSTHALFGSGLWRRWQWFLVFSQALQAETAGVTGTRRIAGRCLSRDTLPGHRVYVGRGSFPPPVAGDQMAIPLDPWTQLRHGRLASPLRVRTSDLWQQLAELRGKTLVCDCPLHQMCEADVLIGLYFDACQFRQASDEIADSKLRSRTVMLLLPRGVALPVMSQEAVVLAFRKLFPGEWFDKFKFPWWRT